MATSNPQLIMFGQENLQRGIYNVSIDDTRSVTAAEPQAIQQARANGASVVNTKLGAKQLTVSGWHKVDSNGYGSSDLETLFKTFDKIFVTDEEQFLRKIPYYFSLLNTESVTGISVSNDAVNLALNTDRFQLNTKSSIGFDVDVSNTGTDVATISGSLTSTDLSSFTDTGNFEFWLYIPDVYYITSIDFRIGSDSSNYYSENFTSTYDGRPFKYGWNYFSVPWNGISETGTVVDTAIDYFWIQLNYSSSAEDITGCNLGGILWVDENQVRNFPCYRQGEIQRTSQHYEFEFTEKWTATFLNHTGYAISTHLTSLFDQDTVTGLSNTQSFTLDGSFQPLPRIVIDINDATNIGNFILQNLNNLESLTLNPDSLAASDNIVFGAIKDGLKLKINSLKNGSTLDFTGIIPNFDLGLNRLQLALESDTPTTVSYSTGTNISEGLITNDTQVLYSQKFTATATGTVTKVKIPVQEIQSRTGVKVSIYSDDGSGDPDTNLGTIGQFSTIGLTSITEIEVTGGSASVTNATDYHVVVTRKSTGFDPTGDVRWVGNTTGSTARESSDGGSNWSAISTYTFRYEVTIEPTPGWDIDWEASYYKLYTS